MYSSASLMAGKLFVAMETLMFLMVFSGLAVAQLADHNQDASYECTIQSILENRSGTLEPRSTPDRGVGNRLTVDGVTGRVSGYFSSEDWQIIKVRRPPGDGLLTIEHAQGLIGSGANRMRIEPAKTGQASHVFTYLKNWLVVTGICRVVN